MEDLRRHLQPYLEYIPEAYRDWFPPEVWAAFALVAALAVLLIILRVLRAIVRGLLSLIPRRERDWDEDMRYDIASLPEPNLPPALGVYHVPGTLRLLVVAAAGAHEKITPDNLVLTLERAVPGLGKQALRDRPKIDIWPTQLSEAGFVNAFHRCTPLHSHADAGTSSEFVIIAGKAMGGGKAVMIGVVVRTAEATTFGRINVSEVGTWLDVLKLHTDGVMS